MIHSKFINVELFNFSLNCSENKRQYFYQLLSDEEKDRAGRYRFDIHRDRFITGRGTIREILAHMGNTKPHLIQFEVNSYGKPAINEPERLTGVKFNASSSHDMGVIALANNNELGIDIEHVKLNSSIEDFDAIVRGEFTQEEHDGYNAQTRQDKAKRFYTLWTCKEAYLKALGIGLNEKLNSFSISFKHQHPVISKTSLEDSSRSKYSLYQLMSPEKYITCLAIPGNEFKVNLTNW